MYVNDLIFLFKATFQACQTIQQALQTYRTLFSHIINKEKSKLYLILTPPSIQKKKLKVEILG